MLAMKSVLRQFLIVSLLLVPVDAVAQRSGATSYTDDRINQLQQALADLSSRLETLKNTNQQLQQQMDKMRADYGNRLERLEKGGAVKPPTPRTGQSRP